MGFVVDAGPNVGYGHVVRCLRIADALKPDVAVAFYPLSESCERFLSDRGLETRSDSEFPGLVVIDLSRDHAVTEVIEHQSCRHISVRDMGLAQCDSDVVIDPSIMNLVPYGVRAERKMFVGPDYTVVTPWRPERRAEDNVVFVTLGGGVDRDYLGRLVEALANAGFQVDATEGFGRDSTTEPERRWQGRVRWIRNDDQIQRAVSRCLFAISNAGVSLYEMLAAGVPTIALSFDELQLQTAVSFRNHSAVESAGVMSELRPEEVVERANELHQDRPLMHRLAEAGRKLVDGKGLFRVTEIMRRELCLTM